MNDHVFRSESIFIKPLPLPLFDAVVTSDDWLPRETQDV